MPYGADKRRGNYFQAAVWSALEPGMGIISACLPCLAPILRRIFKKNQHDPSRGDTMGSGSTGSRRRWWSISEATQRHDSKVSEEAQSMTNISSERVGYKASAFHREGDDPESPLESDGLALDVIQVQSEVECHSDRVSARQV